VHGVIQKQSDTDYESGSADFIKPVRAEALFDVRPIAFGGGLGEGRR